MIRRSRHSQPGVFPVQIHLPIAGQPSSPEVIFAEDLCKGCELCVTVCPTKILKLDLTRVNLRGYFPAIVYNLAQCSGCGSCAKMCPDSVITVRR
jgi:2-oxoglutarate ferredoxin oxidoreductase subunit delta